MINKYIIAVLTVLNAILLMVLFGIMPFLLYLSVAANIVLVWYIVKNLEASEEVKLDMETTLQSLEKFLDHLEELYGLETFYGDQTLKDLIDHSREIINEFIDFQEIHYDAEVELETDDDIQDQEETPQSQE